MSLFDSISRTLKGLLNDAADSVQDPSRDARQIVRELDDSIGRAENSLIEIQAQVATQRSKRDAADDKAKKYEDGAKRALQAGDEALAREALAAQANVEAERNALAAELATLEPSVEKLIGGGVQNAHHERALECQRETAALERLGDESRKGGHRRQTRNECKTGRCDSHTSPSTMLPGDYAGAVALPGLTSEPDPPDDGSPAAGGVLFGERGGRPSMMSLI